MNVLKKIPFAGLTAVLCMLTALCIGMTVVLKTYSHYVNDYLGTVDTAVVNENVDPETIRYKSDYFPNTVYNPAERAYTDAQAAEFMKDKLAFIETAAGEGITLLKNNGALPLTGDKITCLGRGSADLHYCSTSGSGMIPTTNAVRLDAAFAADGVTINPDMYSFYEGRQETYRTAEGGNKAAIGETPVSAIGSDLLATFGEYGDAAVVIFTRPGGEGNDLVAEGGGEDFEGSQLNLNKDELDVLELAKREFDNVVVVLNTDNPIGIGDMKTDDGIDAIVWAGGLGINGANSLAGLLTGRLNFSGRLPDTYATDSRSSAAAQNCGDYSFTNADEIRRYVGHDTVGDYVVEAEGNYIGYKYYETRYEDYVLGGRNADCAKGVYASDGAWDYSAETGYTFGYGMSYSVFEQTFDEMTVSDDGKTVEIAVTVENVSGPAGKDVVQIWYQSPYTGYDAENGVEKSAVQLADYVKTDMLAEGESKQYTVTVELANCASYDAKGAGTYIMDAGEHYFALGNGAHDALNNILAAKDLTDEQKARTDAPGDASKVRVMTVNELDDKTFSTSRYTGKKITNLFDDADITKWTDGVTYLTRGDWNTFPETYDGLTASEGMMKRLACNEDITGEDYSRGRFDDAPSVTYDSDETEYALFMLAGKEFDDPMWDGLLDQLSMRDTSLIVGIGNCETVEIPSINKQKTMGGDGPTGFAGIISGQTFNGNKLAIRCYMSETLLSGTWNKELASTFGYMLGEDGLFINKTDLWGPGANLHRTPFSGRNAEYPTEDGVLGYEQLAAQCAAMTEKGLIAAPKHFAFNDQETNRNGLATFVREQSAREIILRVFEGAFTEGGAKGTMSSFPRIGLDYMGMSYNLLQEYLRGELGFLGYITTDMAGATAYMRPVESVKAGVTLYDNNSTTQADILYEAMPDDEILQKAMREAAHYTLYAFANSNAMNGYDENARIVHLIPWWLGACIGITVGVGTLMIASVTLHIAVTVNKRRSGEAEA